MSRKGKRAVFNENVIGRARSVIGSASYGDELIMAISVMLTGVLKLTGEQVGSVLGVSVSTVVRMNDRFRKEETKKTNEWGGDRRSILSPAMETEILSEMEVLARGGQIVLAAQVKSAIEAKTGTEISLQTAYNVLHRAGWRKVMPDKEHPKGDNDKREEFKKKRSRRRWIWQPSQR